MDTKLIVSASPHLRSEETTQSLMANVIVALCPCVVASAIIFGLRVLCWSLQCPSWPAWPLSGCIASC